jgi:hypothetical protein
LKDVGERKLAECLQVCGETYELRWWTNSRQMLGCDPVDLLAVGQSLGNTEPCTGKHGVSRRTKHRKIAVQLCTEFRTGHPLGLDLVATGVLIEHLSVTGRNDRIERPAAEAGAPVLALRD